MTAAVSGLSPVIMTVRMPMARSWSKRSRMPPLTMSLRWITPERAGRRGRRRAACRPGRRRRASVDSSSGGTSPPCCRTQADDRRRRRPCGSAWPSRSMPLMRVCAVNAHERGLVAGRCARPRRPNSLASTTIERPSGVSSASEASCAASASSSSVTPGIGMNSVGLPVAERDGAGLVEQQRVDVAGRLHGAAGHGEHVVPHQAVHAGDADGREQPADGGRDEADEQGDQHRRPRRRRRCRWRRAAA